MYNLFTIYINLIVINVNITVSTTTYMQIIPEIMVNCWGHSVLWM